MTVFYYNGGTIGRYRHVAAHRLQAAAYYPSDSIWMVPGTVPAEDDD